MCSESPTYFVNQYLYIYAANGLAEEGEAGTPDWVAFRLWQAQVEALEMMHMETRLVILKARQLGLSWLSLGYALWRLTFHAPSTVLLFSLRETESSELLERLKGMYRRLPPWLQARYLIKDSRTHLELSTGSRALAFSTRSGRSYSGSLAIVDEADYIPNLDQFLNAVKPTVDGGGQLFLISTSDKRLPLSTFKNLFRAAGNGADDEWRATPSAYKRLFLPWHAHPGRDAVWHARTKAEMYAQRGTDDDFLAEYPATPEEALTPEQHDRRIPLAQIQACMLETALLQMHKGPSLPGLAVYVAPQAGAQYVLGADPAEGNPRSDASAATVLNATTWEQCAVLAGQIEPTVFADYLAQLAAWYNGAAILPERNNHGHTVLAALRERGQRVIDGHDRRPGWLSSVKGKSLLYNALADAVREGDVVVHCIETAAQIASIEASSLRAPQGLHDDHADAFALAVVAARDPKAHAEASHVAVAEDPLDGIDDVEWE